MPTRALTPTLIERDDELRAVEAVLDSAVEGEGRALIVRGDAGIGKTALLAAAAQSARGRGCQVLEARADALESELSFGVCMQLFEPLHRVTNGDEDGGLFSGAAALARPVLGQGVVVIGAPGEDRTLPLMNGLYWLCANLAERGPALLSVDDAHWSDVPSLQFLRFLARRLEGIGVALLVAARPTATGDVATRYLSGLAEHTGVGVTRPAALSEDAVGELVRAELGEFEPPFAGACARLSGGNPLYVQELLRSAREHGIEPTERGVEALSELHPERITASVVARVDASGDQARALANATAVGSGRLALRDVAEIANLDHRQARGLADELAASAILTSGEPLGFTHPLVRAAVYDSIPDVARAGLPAEVAERLHETGAPHEVVAGHLLSAEHRCGPWALDELEAAAAEAMSRGSPTAAARYLRRALDEGPAPERRAQVLVSLGLAEAEGGDPRGAERLAAAVEALPTHEMRAGTMLGLGMALTAQGEVSRATAAYERGIAALAGAQGSVARDLEALCAIGLAHDREARAGALPRIEALLDDPDLDRSPTGRLLLAQAAAERGYQGGSIDELRALAGRALAPGLDEDQPAAFWTCVLAAYAYDDCDEYERAERAAARALEMARRRGSVVQASAACHPSAFVNLRRGRVDRALADAQTSVEGAEQGWRLALPSSRAVLAAAHIERGELDAASAAVNLPGGDAPWERLISFGWLLAARGRLELERGEPQKALATFLACGELCEQARVTNPSVISWRTGAALAAARLGEAEQGRELIDEELERARRYGAPRALGAALRTFGLVLGDERGIAALRESLGVLEGSQAELERSRTLVELGAALRRSGQRRDSRGPLREGLDLASRCGATKLADRALEELHAAGGRPRRREMSGAEALTPSERRIVALAADGLSNPQIAQALFVTRRTVEMHLTNAYRKLDVGGRDELGGAMAEAR
ncbi:MAG TPA: AAA family ATPase [Solirubrobacterales bacterium]